MLLYCCVVLDTFSRCVVGWSIDHRQDTALVTNALGMAITNRNPDAEREVVIHSDHSTQFTSWAFTRRARQSGLVAWMGSIGDCYDNAVIESFWGRMQTELLDRKRWEDLPRQNGMTDSSIPRSRNRGHITAVTDLGAVHLESWFGLDSLKFLLRIAP